MQANIVLKNKNKSQVLDKSIIHYCLYAGKSSESDERPTMSIDSQMQEIKTLAARENLFIKEIRGETQEILVLL